MEEMQIASCLATEIQQVSAILKEQGLDGKRLTRGVSDSLTSLPVRHAQAWVANLDKKQAAIIGRLAASSKRESLCHRQLESQAMSLPGKQHVLAALEAEKLLKAGYNKQLLSMKTAVQDTLLSLCETLKLDQQQAAAPEADVIELLSTSANKLGKSASMGAAAFQYYDQQPFLHGNALQRLHSGKPGTRSGTSAHNKSNDSSYGSSDSPYSPVISSGMSTSKASRYLQKHGVSRPPALQQMQSLSQHQDGQTQAVGNGFSLADSCSAMAGMAHQPVQQLLIPAQHVVLPHDHADLAPDNAATAAAAFQEVAQGMQQEVIGSQEQQSDPSVDMQLRQNMLRSHPVPHSQTASRAVSPYSYDSPPTGAIARLKAESASKGLAMGRTQSLPSQANPGLERSTSSNTGLSGFSCSTLLHALQDSVLQLEARASIAEAGKAVAQQQLAQLRQQMAAEGQAHEAQVSMLTAQLAHQDAVLAGAAQYLGPLESRANPVSPVLSPRLSNAPQDGQVVEQELQ